MNIPYIDFLFSPLFRSESPHFETLDEYIDDVLPKIVPYSEDLYEEEYYTEKLWREVNDRDEALDIIGHIFKKKDNPHEIKEKSDAEGPNYLKSVDGNIMQGQWAIIGSNITLRTAANYELFERAFLNDDFFILKKHGDKHLEGTPKYLVMGKESLIKGKEWREVVELLYGISNYSKWFPVIITVVAIIILVALMLST